MPFGDPCVLLTTVFCDEAAVGFVLCLTLFSCRPLVGMFPSQLFKLDITQELGLKNGLIFFRGFVFFPLAPARRKSALEKPHTASLTMKRGGYSR